MEIIQNYIDGKWFDAQDKGVIENIAPATGKVYSTIPRSGHKDVDMAVSAARKAFKNWSQSSKDERSKILYTISQLIKRDLEELALAESRDNGKPLTLAKKTDIPRAAHNFRFFATAILHFASESHHMEGTAINYTLRNPLGVAACISPWNLPLYLFTWKIAPAIAAGNCVVAKPSEITPMTAYLLSKICAEAGLPDGVLNIVHGYGHEVGDAITRHEEVDAISFTGGTKTGEQIAKIAAPKFKKLSLELGGKNPTIIFDDCDYEKMLKTTIRSSFLNQGQICLCGSRIFIHKNLYERFKKDFIAKVEDLKVGDPNEIDTDQGALVSESHLSKVLSYVELAKEEGGTLLTGGYQLDLSDKGLDGFFMKPTVFENLPYDCRTNQEEVFGPFVTLTPFEDEEEVINYANSTSYGLAASIWTNDINKINRVSEAIQTGIVWVNCWLIRDLRTPFGGMKNSGVGREGGFEALRFFTEPKNICVKY